MTPEKRVYDDIKKKITKHTRAHTHAHTHETKENTTEKKTSEDSLNIWNALPKVAVNINKLTQRAKVISHRIKEKGLLFSLDQKKWPRYKCGKDVYRVDTDILERRNTLQSKQYKLLRVLHNLIDVNGEDMGDPKNLVRVILLSVI